MPPPPSTVREIRADDLPAFLEASPSTASMGPYLLRQQSNGIGTALLAHHREQLVGYVELCWTWPPEARNLHVFTPRRNQGFGTLLLAAAEVAASARADALQLRVGTQNPEARRLYDRLGYTATGEFEETTYSFIDETGAQQTATEVDEFMVKRLVC